MSAPPPLSQDEILFSNSPLSLLRRHGQGGFEALLRYAAAMQAGHPPCAPLAGCSMIPELPADHRLVYHWIATVAPNFDFTARDVGMLLLGIGFAVQHKVILFQTVHGFSAAGARRAARLRLLSKFVYAFAFFLLLVGLAATLLPAIGAVCFALDRTARDMVLPCVLGTLAGAAVLATAIGAILLTKRLEVPARLRYIPRYPFSLHGVTAADR